MSNRTSGELMFPHELAEAVDAAVPNGVTHVGIVPSDISGRILVSNPHGQPYGVSASFSKVERREGELPSAALTRCLTEQVGLRGDSIYPIDQVWITPNSTSFYFAGLVSHDPQGVHSATADLRWCEADEARVLLGSSKNATSRNRDMALLGRVQRMTLSPCRNILLMLQELHRLGFERLRAHCYIYATGTWRCEIIPASWLTDQNRMTHDASPYGLRERLQSLLGLNNIIGFYSSANGQRAFQTEGAVFLSPRDLAKQYLQEYPVIAGAGYGPDPEYAAWYDGMLDTLAPNGVFYAYAEYTEPADHLYAHMARVNTVPLPPPVKLDASEWQRFLTRFEPD